MFVIVSSSTVLRTTRTVHVNDVSLPPTLGQIELAVREGKVLIL